MDEIDRALSTHEPLGIPTHLTANVMAEIRAIAKPARHAFPWQPFAVKTASCGSIAFAAAVVFSHIDTAIFVPAARELTVAAAILIAAFIAIYFPRLSMNVRD